ncbi:hypothetical protein L195_g006048 [Trifolium pratense]|uniref:Uncharacterized protein n=1 Tax=Trifolium pratense TaxID=57577 RepID=A0A2K3P2H9_TRIPR|nr:hypothetical protein L195_g006048 [Trifolium pratense]
MGRMERCKQYVWTSNAVHGAAAADALDTTSDSSGQFVLACTSWLQGTFSIIEDEAIALMEATKEVKRRDFANVIFDTVSKSFL